MAAGQRRAAVPHGCGLGDNVPVLDAWQWHCGRGSGSRATTATGLCAACRAGWPSCLRGDLRRWLSSSPSDFQRPDTLPAGSRGRRAPPHAPRPCCDGSGTEGPAGAGAKSGSWRSWPNWEREPALFLLLAGHCPCLAAALAATELSSGPRGVGAGLSVPTVPAFPGLGRSRCSYQAWLGLGQGQGLGMQQPLPLPAGKSKCQAPGGGCVGGYSPHPAPGPAGLSWASPWGLPCREHEWSSVVSNCSLGCW